MNRGGTRYPNVALRLLVKRVDRQLALSLGLPDSKTDEGMLSPVRGELMMVRAALHCACADLYGAVHCQDAEVERRSAARFLSLVSPGLMADKARIEAYLAHLASGVAV